VVRLRAQCEAALLRRVTQGRGLGAAKIQRYRDQASLAMRMQIELQQAFLRRLSQEHLMLNTRKGRCRNLGGALAISRAKPLRSGAALLVFAHDGACNSRRK
jgi:hypothetical protein